jgi:hypothetical protein
MTKTNATEIPTTALLLNRWLSDIFDLGDNDEMSWKHVGHGVAALLAFDNWREAVDYSLPDEVLFPPAEQKLEALWDCVADIMKKQGKQWVLDVLPLLAERNWKLMYCNSYVQSEWLGYLTPIEKQNLEVRKEH